MRKPVHRPPRSPAAIVPREVRDTRPLVARILDTPQLARVVPRLPPEMVHGIIQRCGLEACGELVALATSGQLARVFDLDLWHAGRPGVDEAFDADRFGVWLEVLVESGDDVAAEKLAGMEAGLISGAIAHYVRVIDNAAGVRVPDEAVSCEVGGYRVVAKRAGPWDALVAVLIALETDHQQFFHQMMHGCRDLSHAEREIDGLDDLLAVDAQAMFDLAVDRERRREQQGYATPNQARAFLQMARQSQPAPGAAPLDNPIARAYFSAIAWAGAADAADGPPRLLSSSGEAVAPDEDGGGISAVVDLLQEAGVLPSPPRALLDAPGGGAPALARMHAHLQAARDRLDASYAMRSSELAYLANVLAAGCSIQSRAITPQEASAAAVAVCNLGLENWPSGWPAPDDLISVFQVGWHVLYADVCMETAAQLIAVLKALRCEDRETQAGITALRLELTKQWRAGTPWRAAPALDAIAVLDAPAWAALVALIDECPVLHAALAASAGSGVRAVSASAFEFISENSQIAAVRAFMRSLSQTLRG